MNDLETTAWSLAEMADGELETLQAGAPQPGNRALIAAGTGLGEALVIWDGKTWRPSASEGGHADFAPRDELEDGFLRWLRARHGRVSYERVLSGQGLADLYRFLTETHRGAASATVAHRFATAEDPAAIVTEAALDGSCERARLALERFVAVYGAEAGNLALKALAVNGVYVGGGIAPRILPFLSAGAFARAFAAKGRLSPMLERIPVRLILDDRAALWGAAAVALHET
jgi:glucokinase